MNSIQHGKEEFDKEYYSRFFKENGDLDFNTYRNWFDGWYRFVKRYVDLRESKDKKVLELGCAIGAFSRILYERGFDVTATDISDFVLREATHITPGVKFRKLDIEKSLKIQEKFDYIFAFEVLEHLKDPEKALKNIKSLLRPEGVFIFSTPFVSEQTLNDPTHINVHNPDWWIRHGKSVGFSNVKFNYVSFLPYLYRYARIFSIGFPVKINHAMANSTTMFFFKK